MNRLIAVGILTPLLSIGLLRADETPGWDYPDDIPKIEPVSVGLAGQKNASIVRYLMARGALRAAPSPDGTQIAYSSRVSGEPQLWLVDATGGWPEQLTFGSGIRTFRWAPNGQQLLVTRDTDGDEREGFYLLSGDGQRETAVLPPSDAFRVFGMFSPDGTRILYASTERNGRDFDVYVKNIASGDNTLVYEGSFGFYPRAWQPGGELVLVDEVRGEGSNDVHLLDLASGEMRRLFHPPDVSYHGSYQWLADGSGFFMASNNGRDYRGLAFVDMQKEEVTFLETPEADVESVTLTADDRYLAWTQNEDGYSRLYVRDRDSGELLSPSGLPDGIYGIAFADDAPRLMIRVSAPSIPGDVYSWDVSSEAAPQQAVRSTLAGLAADSFVAPESLTYEARDGVELQGFLYLPEDSLSPPPVVVRVHGGPTSQSRPTFRNQVQYLVDNGIAVFDVNVRGSTGYGKAFAALDDREKRLDSVRDLVDTVEFLKSDKRLNAERAAVMGGSYGGYMVNAVLGAYPDVFDAGASFVGVSDWVRALEEASPSLKASDRIEYGDIRDERWQEFYRLNSPINNADKIRVPLFVEHGANDPRDPVTESDRIVKTVRDNGGDVTYLRFPDEGHSLSKQANRVAFNRALMRFLEQHLLNDDPASS